MPGSMRVVQPQQDWTTEHTNNTPARAPKTANESLRSAVGTLPLWQLDIVELTGHNLEARGREEVNRLLQTGWLLLHIYTLRYREDNVWRERPMAILGLPRRSLGEMGGSHEASGADHLSQHPVVGNR